MSDQFYTPANENMEMQNEPNGERKVPLNLIKSLLDIVVSPKDVFEKLSTNGASFWFPTLLIAFSMIGFMFFYMNTVLPVDMINYLFLMEPDLQNK